MTPKVLEYMNSNRMTSKNDCEYICTIALKVIPSDKSIHERLRFFEQEIYRNTVENRIIEYLKNPPKIEVTEKEHSQIIKDTKEIFETNTHIQDQIKNFDLIRVRSKILNELIKSPYKFSKSKYFSENYCEDVESYDTCEEFKSEDPTAYETEIVNYILNVVYRWRNDMGSRNKDSIETIRSSSDLANDDQTRLEMHKMGTYEVGSIYERSNSEHLSVLYQIFKVQKLMKTKINILSVWHAYMDFRSKNSYTATNTEMNFSKWEKAIMNYEYVLLKDEDNSSVPIWDLSKEMDLHKVLSKVFIAMKFNDESKSDERGLSDLSFLFWKLCKMRNENSLISHFMNNNFLNISATSLENLSSEIKAGYQIECLSFLKRLYSIPNRVNNLVSFRLLQGEYFGKDFLKNSSSEVFNQLTYSKYFADVLKKEYVIEDIVKEMSSKFPLIAPAINKVLKNMFSLTKDSYRCDTTIQKTYMIASFAVEFNKIMRLIKTQTIVDTQSSEFFNSQITIIRLFIEERLKLYSKSTSIGEDKDIKIILQNTFRELGIGDWSKVATFNSDNILSVGNQVCIIRKEDLLRIFEGRISHKNQSEAKKEYTKYINNQENDICLIGKDGNLYLIPSSFAIGSKIMRLWVNRGELIWELVLYQYVI